MPNQLKRMVLRERIELSTSPLPMDIQRQETPQNMGFTAEARQILHDMFSRICQVSVRWVALPASPLSSGEEA